MVYGVLGAGGHQTLYHDCIELGLGVGYQKQWPSGLGKKSYIPIAQGPQQGMRHRPLMGDLFIAVSE